MALPNVAPTYQFIGGESQDGLIIGLTSASLLRFYGSASTPIARASLSATAAVATTAPSSTQVAFTITSAQVTDLIALANALRTALVNLNLVST